MGYYFAVEVDGERIVSVTKRSEAPKSDGGSSSSPRVLDYGNAVIMPGLIDAYASSHNTPGLSIQVDNSTKLSKF